MSHADPPTPLRCLALTRAGQPCRAWAMRDSPTRLGRPLCHAHAAGVTPAAALPVPIVEAIPLAQPLAHRAYAPYFTPGEVDALDLLARAATEGDSLAAEVETARVILMRLLAHLNHLGEPTTAELVALAPLVLQSTRTIALLLQYKQALRPAGEEDSFQTMLFAQLAELAEEWGLAE